MRLGYQISVDIEAHRRNLESREPPEPVIVLAAILDGDVVAWERKVHQVRCLESSETQYGWGEERAHARGRRNGAAVWVFTSGPVEYRDIDGRWHRLP